MQPVIYAQHLRGRMTSGANDKGHLDSCTAHYKECQETLRMTSPVRVFEGDEGVKQTQDFKTYFHV